MKAIVLAGGKGTRLAPYTKVLPKPLMPIGDMPILEILLRQMRRAGIQEVYLAVGHLAGLLQAFFQDGTANPPNASKLEANIKATRGFQQIPNEQITLSSGVLKQNAGW